MVHCQESLATLLCFLDNLLPDFQRVDSSSQGSETCSPFLPCWAGSLLPSWPCSEALHSRRSMEGLSWVLWWEGLRRGRAWRAHSQLCQPGPDLALVILPCLCREAGPPKNEAQHGLWGGCLKLSEGVQSLRRPARIAQWQDNFSNRPVCGPWLGGQARWESSRCCGEGVEMMSSWTFAVTSPRCYLQVPDGRPGAFHPSCKPELWTACLVHSGQIYSTTRWPLCPGK